MVYNYDYFISYAHGDDMPQDDAEVGFVSEFVSKLVENREFRQLFGIKPRVFFDKDVLHGMDDWNSRIRDALASSRFFVVMLSPNYFKSNFCGYEFEQWVLRETQRQLVREDAAPIQIVNVDDLLDHNVLELGAIREELRKKYPKWVKDLRRYQFFRSEGIATRQNRRRSSRTQSVKQ